MDFGSLSCVNVGSSTVINIPFWSGGVDNRGCYACGYRGGVCLSPQFCCEPKTALKKESLFKNSTVFPHVYIRIISIEHLSNKKSPNPIQIHCIILILRTCVCVFKLGGTHLSTVNKKDLKTPKLIVIPV